MTYILTAGKKKRWPFTDYSLTSQNVVNLQLSCSKTDKMICQSTFVRGEAEQQDKAGGYLDVTLFHRIPESLASVCDDSTWHMTGKGLLSRSSQKSTSDNQLTWLTDSLITLTNWLTSWLTDDPAVEGCRSTQIISKEGKQAADWEWRVEWKKLAHGKPLCLLGKWSYAATHQSWSHSSPSRHPLHTASVPPQSPSKLEKSEIAAEREEKKMEKDSKTLLALCARLPSGTSHGAHS